MKNLWRFLKYWYRVAVTKSRFYADMHRDYEDGLLEIVNHNVDVNRPRDYGGNVTLTKREWNGKSIVIDERGYISIHVKDVMAFYDELWTMKTPFNRLYFAIFDDIKAAHAKREVQKLKELDQKYKQQLNQIEESLRAPK